MKHFLVQWAIVIFLSFSAHSQEKITKHTVAKGETITQIAQKYKVTPADIYRLNPDSQNGLKPDMVLLIQSSGVAKEKKAEPKSEPKSQPASTAKTHTVAAKETVYGLAKMYNVSVQDLEKANPEIVKDGLQIGKAITIPAKGTVARTETKPEAKEAKTKPDVKTETKPDKKDNKKSKEVVYHQVEAKETKYSIARQYGITIQELEAANPEITSGLQIGFRLKIIGSGAKKENAPVAKEEEPVKAIEPKKPEFSSYEVKPKETLYSLTKKFGMTQDDLIKLNPELKDGVKEGMTLKYPANVALNETVDKIPLSLSKSISNQNKKQLVLLLPFNISKIEKDTVNSTTSRLKTDKFLNMTLDFYSGALMAIDSAKTMGMNIDVKIFDSQETKNSSNVASIIEQNHIQNANVVIGPFYQANVEKAAELLNKSNVPVISPLSKETTKSYNNLLLSMPSSETAKNAIFDYMHSKEGNIVAIVDPKKISSKQYLVQNHKEVKLVALNEKGAVEAQNVSSELVKGKMNYVILDSEKTGMILNTTNILIDLMVDYQIQLVILEKNETLDFEEIPLAKLAKLNLLYPSLTRDNETPEAAIFEKDYKAKNKIFPNQYATRGFDITFDTMLRLSQEKTFMETVDSTATEQVESKFDYEKKSSGSYTNKGIYILYYDTDLSVKEAK